MVAGRAVVLGLELGVAVGGAVTTGAVVATLVALADAVDVGSAAVDARGVTRTVGSLFGGALEDSAREDDDGASPAALEVVPRVAA